MKWIHEERDLKTVFLYFIPEGRMTVWSWLSSYRGRRVYAYAAWDDPGPIVPSPARVLKAAWRRLKRRVAGGKKQKEMEELLLAADPAVGRRLRRVDFE